MADDDAIADLVVDLAELRREVEELRGVGAPRLPGISCHARVFARMGVTSRMPGSPLLRKPQCGRLQQLADRAMFVRS
jgi:hypothetical protein